MNDRDTSTLPTICQECGHRASLHRVDGCGALLLGRGNGSRTCTCTKTARAILGAQFPSPPAEIEERAERERAATGSATAEPTRER
jgi:hypothetical protein